MKSMTNSSLSTLSFNMTLSIYNVTTEFVEENLISVKQALQTYFEDEIVKSIKIYSMSVVDLTDFLNMTIPGISFLCGLVLYTDTKQPEQFYKRIVNKINSNQFNSSLFLDGSGNSSDIFNNAIFDDQPIASKAFLFQVEDDQNVEVGVDDFLLPNIDIIVQPEERPPEWWVFIYLLIICITVKYCSCKFKLVDFCYIFPSADEREQIQQPHLSPLPISSRLSNPTSSPRSP